MKVHEIMTAHARCAGPDNTLVEAAGLMRELNVGALPVCENERLAGMVTDRDMVLRGIAQGRDPNVTTVREVMSSGVLHVFADQSDEEATRLMEEKQVRRLPVLNREKRLVGILSLGDVATSSTPAFSGLALRDISQPHEPTARQRRLFELSRTAAPVPSVAGQRRRPNGSSRRQTSSRAKSPRGTRTSRSRNSAASRGKTSSTRRSSARSGRTSKRQKTKG